MKKYHSFSLFLFLILIFITKECKDDEISKNINSCISIDKLLNDPTEELDISDINYISRTIQSISRNGYEIDILKLNSHHLQSKNILQSKIYISKKCLESMEENLQVDISTGLVIIVSNNNITNSNGIPERYFVIRFSGSGENKYLNSGIYDFSICSENPILLNMTINIDEIKAFKKKEKENANDRDVYEKTDINIQRVLYAKKYNVDLFDLHSDFLENICFKFKSEKDTDVTLETRLLDYYQNVTLCNIKHNAHYMNFNYTPINKTLIYSCAYGYFKNAKEKKSYIEKLDAKMNIVFSNSNFKVITCYKEILKYKLIYKNYGELICLFVFFMQLILFMSFCCQGTSPLRKQIDELIAKAPKVSPILEFQRREKNANSDKTRIVNNQNDINYNLPPNNNNVNKYTLNIKNNNNKIPPNNDNPNNNNNKNPNDNSFISSANNDLESNYDAQSNSGMINNKNKNLELPKKIIIII